MRVAFVAGTLECGGAEKQLCYMVGALAARGVRVRVYAFAAGGRHWGELTALGVPPEFVGRRASPLLRVPALVAAARPFAPHVVQSGHFYTNLYAAACGRALGAWSIGAVRNDLLHEFAANGRWSRWLLRAPTAVVCNSWRARGHAARLMDPRRLHVIPNVIDLQGFDRGAGPGAPRPPERPVTLVTVARCVPAKRLDRFLRVVHGARASGADVRGVLVGDGPERPALEALAAELGLAPDRGVRFLGARHDVPRLLGGMDVLLLTSDHEGFPNVLLEAMAAGLPVVTTRAGDAARVVDDGVTGYVVPPHAIGRMVERVVRLARRPELRHELGSAGRARVERRFALDGLADALLDCYRDVGAARAAPPTAARTGGGSQAARAAASRSV